MVERGTVWLWAHHEVGALALKAMAEKMPGVHEARKGDVIEWLMQHEYETLEESYRLSQRRGS